MTTYNFDQHINRYGTDCIKFDFKSHYKKPEDVLPMWVADMDFAVPDDVTEAIMERARHGIYGYTIAGEEYNQAVIGWMKRRHGYTIEQDWILQTPGVVYAIVMSIRAFTNPGDAVMIQTPVYYPFYKSIYNNGRKLVTNPLIYQKDKEVAYTIDLKQFEQAIIENDVKLFVLCNPHNPVGRVWTREELMGMGEILKRHNVLVVSDEIHMDFVFSGHKHLVFAGLSEEFEHMTITCTAPSKTFNLAGLQLSNIILANETLRTKLRQEINATGYSEANVFGLVACQAAYEHGDEYVDQLNEYVQGNIDYIDNFLKENLPKAHLIRPEGTYLLWIDFSEYGISIEKMNERILHKAKLWFNSGEIFGVEGKGFQRINVATNRLVIEQALEQLKDAFSDLGDISE